MIFSHNLGLWPEQLRNILPPPAYNGIVQSNRTVCIAQSPHLPLNINHSIFKQQAKACCQQYRKIRTSTKKQFCRVAWQANLYKLCQLYEYRVIVTHITIHSSLHFACAKNDAPHIKREFQFLPSDYNIHNSSADDICP